jgi:enoyl-[acyl-carrier protein] reductase II
VIGRITSRFADLVGIAHPVVQEGLGPYKSVALAAAVSNAGGLGCISIPPLTIGTETGGRMMRQYIEDACALTDRPLSVNVPVGVAEDGEPLPYSAAYVQAVLDAVKDPAIAARVRVITTSAGAPGAARALIADSGLVHMHKVGGTRQAIKAQEAGVDVLIASGYEAGGHTHARPVHTFVLAPNVAQAVDIPVVVAGGIRDGATMAAALTLGADAVALGTRFVATYDNTDWHPAYAEAVIRMAEGDDTTVQAIYGPSRMLRNGGSRRLEDLNRSAELDHDAMTRWKDERLVAAMRDGDLENGIVPMGQVASAITSLVHVAEFIPEMVADAIEALRRTAARTAS